MAKKIFLSIISAIAIWFHIIPILGATTTSWGALGGIAIFIFISIEFSDSLFEISFSLIFFSILIGLGFLGFDIYHFLKDGFWNPTTLYSLFGKHVTYSALQDWRGLIVVSSWLWDNSIYWWLPIIGCIMGFIWLGAATSEDD